MERSSEELAALRALPLHERAEMALREAVQEVIERHARLGLPIFIWRGGRIIDISSEEAAKRGLKPPGPISTRQD
jgi:hypothetical protein